MTCRYWCPRDGYSFVVTSGAPAHQCPICRKELRYISWKDNDPRDVADAQALWVRESQDIIERRGSLAS